MNYLLEDLLGRSLADEVREESLIDMYELICYND